MAVNAKFDPDKAVDLSGKKVEGGPQENTTQPVRTPVSGSSAVKNGIQQVGAEGPKNTGTINSQVPEVLPYSPTTAENSHVGASGVVNNSNVIQQVGADGSQTGVKTENNVPVVAPSTEPPRVVSQTPVQAQQSPYEFLAGMASGAVLPTQEQVNAKLEADKAPTTGGTGNAPVTGGSNVDAPPTNLPHVDNTGTNADVPTTLPGTGTTAGATNGAANVVPSTLPGAADLSASLKGTMSDWRGTVNAQQQAKIDYAVQQAIAELQRAEQDAQGQFKEQAESVALDERQGMDNAALYAEARGDKGGIGMAQYNEIQAAAAQNRLSVQQAQTKLSTDTARQIADLRAKGEFDKADALLEVSQTYLTQLMQLEQWAANYGLDVEKFNQSLDQWKKEYDLALEKFGYQKAQDSKQSATELGMAMLNAGIPLDEATRQAMGLSKAQADAMYAAAQMGATQTGNGELGSFSNLNEMYTALRQAGVNTEAGVIAQLRSWGVSYPRDFAEAYLDWYDSQGGDTSKETGGGLYAETYAALDGYKAQGYTDEQMWLVIDSLPISDEEKEILVKHYGVE